MTDERTEPEKREYNKYVKPIMDEMSQKLKYITKKKDGSWVIQSRKDSLCEGFFVNTTIYGYIIMTGDYGSLIVRPCGNENRLANWMCGAYSISYFAEKCGASNANQQIEEYSADKAKEEVFRILNDRIEYKELDLDLEADREYKEKIDELKENVPYMEQEHEFYEQLREIENKLSAYDLFEHSARVYTTRFLWQHKCLIFWANKVIDGEFEEEK